jgi:hypothetical protein
MFMAGVLAAQQYFPPGVLDSTAASYSRDLKALHEPSLWELSQRDPKAEAYRFLWLRSSHHPVAVRLVVKPSGSGWIHTRMTSGKGGYQPGRIIRYGVSWLTKRKTQSFLTALQSADFWKLPTLAGEKMDAGAGYGSQWIVEGVKGGQYQIIDRFSPDTADPVRTIGSLALKLGRFRIRSGEVY